MRLQKTRALCFLGGDGLSLLGGDELVFVTSLKCTRMVKKAYPRLRDNAYWLCVATKASLSNLPRPIFFIILVHINLEF